MRLVPLLSCGGLAFLLALSSGNASARTGGRFSTPFHSISAARQPPASSVHVVSGTREKFDQARELIRGLTIRDAIPYLAEFFLGSPYLAMSLDGDGPEQLRLDLTRFDCMLFVEQLLALATAKTFEQFALHTQHLRYRDGEVGYCTRQHYFHNWAEAARSQGLLEASAVLPGQKSRNLSLNFMSNHRELYAPLQSEELFSCIRDSESRVAQQYIPMAMIEAALPSLQSGDLFAIATSAEGLDVSHTGVVVRNGSRVDAIHAAPEKGVIRSRSLSRYLRSVPDAIGLVIVRPVIKMGFNR